MDIKGISAQGLQTSLSDFSLIQQVSCCCFSVLFLIVLTFAAAAAAAAINNVLCCVCLARRHCRCVAIGFAGWVVLAVFVANVMLRWFDWIGVLS